MSHSVKARCFAKRDLDRGRRYAARCFSIRQPGKQAKAEDCLAIDVFGTRSKPLGQRVKA